jgi:hypothetical protein
MSERTGTALAALGAALLLGILGDALLRGVPWGINLFLWTGSLVVAVIALVRWRRIPAVGGGRWLLLVAPLFAAGVAWRDSLALTCLNVAALLLALALAAMRLRSGCLRRASLVEYAAGALASPIYAAAGTPVLVFGDVRWNEVPRAGWSRQGAAVARGLLLAVPLLLLFGGLFAAADPLFERLVSRFFRFDYEEWIGHLVLICAVAWAAGGLLREMLLSSELEAIPGERPACLSLGITEVATVLGTLDLLFLLFVAIQCRYLFGGAAVIHATTGLTVADYARRGFFELATVTALALPLLLLADWLLRKECRAHVRLFRLLAGLLGAMLFLVMASALQRMLLYQQSFGLTEQRFYVTAFIGWLAAVVGWFFVTVLPGRRERFAFGALVAGFAAIALLNAANPDALIMRANAGRIDARHPLDMEYATSLSADAVPEALVALPRLPASERAALAGYLLHHCSAPPREDWRTWNWSRSRAGDAVAAQRPALQKLAGAGGGQ